jgi:hypothetical protein
MANDGVSLPEGFDWRALTPDDSAKTLMDIFGDFKSQRLAR